MLLLGSWTCHFREDRCRMFRCSSIDDCCALQVITDNAANCVAMGKLVNEKYPWIFWSPCAAHCLDLLFEDIAKLPWIAEVLDIGRFLVRFVTKRPRVLSMFREYSSLDILRPAPTRSTFLFIKFDSSLRFLLLRS